MVCDDAAQNCPVELGGGQVKQMGFPDPAAVIGGEAKHLAFRKAQDGLCQKVFDCLENMQKDSSKGGTYAPRNL